MERGESGSPEHSEHAGRDLGIYVLTLDGRREIRKEEKPVVCEQCPKRFAYKRDLKRHFEIHKRKQGLPTALIKCPHCGTTFTLKHNLTRHLSKKHEDIYPMGTRILH